MKVSKKLIAILLISIFVITIGALSIGCFPMQQPTTEEGATEAAEGEEEAGFLAQYGTYIWLAVLVVAFYFLLIRPQRQRSKKSQELKSSLKRGDEVITIGGFYGRIKDVREDSLIITLSSGVDVKVTKEAVSKKASST